jgi:Holliday junction resolvase RusA-like endonuclease
VDPILDIRVYGAPAPQGSKRAVVHKQSGKAIVMESSKRVKPWREAVTAAALATGAGDRAPYDGEVIVSMVFTFARPKSHYRTGRNAHLLRPDAPARPGKPPDLSKLLRSTEDALTHVVWTDDARIVEYGRAAKVWVGEDPDALDRPGAVITVWPARSDAVLSGQLGDTNRPANLFDQPAPDPWADITPAQSPSTEESPS